MDDDHDDGDGHMDDDHDQAWKRRKRKTKWLKANVYLIEAFCFATQDIKWYEWVLER
jgi:hypothetical protein